MTNESSLSRGAWLDLNLANLRQRLAPLARLPDGPVYRGDGHFQKVSVDKLGSVLSLRFFSGNTVELQSSIDLLDPLTFLVTYPKAMMLSLLWRSHPTRVHMVGVGGARLPLVLHHHFPDLAIDCTEIDPEIAFVASKYFALPEDPRVKVILQDGRDYLANRAGEAPYDIILVDVFRGVGFSPFRLATREFQEICKQQLAPDGVVVTNVLERDVLLPQRIQTIAQSFRNVYLFRRDGSVILFADNGPELDQTEIQTRAQAIEAQHAFSFPFATLAAEIAPAREFPEYLPALPSGGTLTDAMSTRMLPVDPEILKQVGRNVPCPCGSGKKFKRCHGQA